MALRRGRRIRPGENLTFWRRASLLAGFALAFVVASPAQAQRELLTKPGQKGQVVIDQISGFRGGVSGIADPHSLVLSPSLAYYGPIGFAVQHYSQTDPRFAQNSDSVTATTFWLAPSADVFVIDHLSVGGMVQIAYTSQSGSVPTSNSQSTSETLPSNFSFAIMPRIGWMFALSDRWAFWPRLSLGYVSNAVGSVPNANGPGTSVSGSSVYGLAIDLDAGLLFRVNETFFVRLAPEFGVIPGAGNSTTNLATSQSVTTGATYLEFTLSGGIGVMFDL
jgi:hypothetical protein